MSKTRKGYLFRRGRIFYACWFVGEKKFVRTTGQSDRRDALKELARIMEPFLIADEVKTLQNVKARIEGAKAEHATLDEQRDPPLRLADAWAAYVVDPDRPDSGDSTLQQYASELKRFQNWVGTNHPEVKLLRDVTTDLAKAYAQHLNAEGASSSTFNQHVNFLSLLWRIVRKRARTETNPWEEIRRKRLISVSRRELTIEELSRVINSAAGEMRLLFILGAYTGMRLGDCATLQWEEVDLARNLIRRVPMKVSRRRNRPVLVPLFPLLRVSLEEAPLAKRRGDVLPGVAEAYRRDSSSLSKRIQAHFIANGMCTQNARDGRMKSTVSVGFHSLRHTLVSLLREKDVPLSVVETLVGHSNPAMTRHYTHTSEAAASRAIALLPSVVNKGVVDRPLAPADPVAALARIGALAARMTSASWEKLRTEILAAVASGQCRNIADNQAPMLPTNEEEARADKT